MKNITIKINKNGEVSIETSGFIGESCIDATRTLEHVFGVEKNTRHLKTEYFQQAEQGRLKVPQNGTNSNSN